MKLIAAPARHAALRDSADLAVLLYARSARSDVATTGAAVYESILDKRVTPDQRAWDFLSIALAANAADWAAVRRGSPDGWTRSIQLTIAVHDLKFWSSQRDVLQRALRFLTTDIWEISFLGGGHVFDGKPLLWAPPEKSVVLLSGGLDSLVGAINLAARKAQPMAVSQVSSGDKDNQIDFAASIRGGLDHVQLNHNVFIPGPRERSQRVRSLVFLAYGMVMATTLEDHRAGKPVTLYVPENGFISINPSLTPGRLGSLSTRTTHPAFFGFLQQVLSDAGLDVQIKNPFQFKTKGEMLRECRDQKLLRRLAARSTSCGRFARNGFTHCGRCVPCVIRRAAFHAWDVQDKTEYVYRKLGKKDERHARFDDVRSLAMAVADVKQNGLDRWLGQSVNSRVVETPELYRDTVRRGLKEVAAFLAVQKVR